MAQPLTVRPQGRISEQLDNLCEPFMRWVSGAPTEAPQETHRWNNMHLTPAAVQYLRSELMVVRTKGDPDARVFPPPLTGTLAHLTRFGGWKTYIAVRPFDYIGEWFIGSRWPGLETVHGAVLSRVPIEGGRGVRVLHGPGPAEWFGVTRAGLQLALYELGSGKIGDGQLLTRLPLK
jgi:hypothetical protein